MTNKKKKSLTKTVQKIQKQQIIEHYIKEREKKKSPCTNSKATQNLVGIDVRRHRDSQGNHYHGIMDEIDNKYISVGFTTKKNKGKGLTNYALDVDPMNSGKQSYMRRQGTVSPKKEYTNLQQGNMTSKDYTQAKVYGERAKQKYINKKDKKK